MIKLSAQQKFLTSAGSKNHEKLKNCHSLKKEIRPPLGNRKERKHSLLGSLLYQLGLLGYFPDQANPTPLKGDCYRQNLEAVHQGLGLLPK